MGIVSNLTCEYPLPIPLDKFGESEEEDFKEVKWDELVFMTSSFVDYSDLSFIISSYTISEDGQFYKDIVEIDFSQDEQGFLLPQEKGKGIERQDFTGEIYFGTEVPGKDYDYSMTFKALLFKGDLKELELEEWEKIGNEERKKAAQKFQEIIKNEITRKNKWWYQPINYLGWVILKVSYVIKRILLWAYETLIRIEAWVNK